MHTTASPHASRIAVVGGGPPASRRQGARSPRLRVPSFEQSRDLGGQWNAGARTQRHLGRHAGEHQRRDDRFSESPPPAGWPLFPTAEQVRDELLRLRRRTSASPRARGSARAVLTARQAGDGWSLALSTPPRRDPASRPSRRGVVAASGRFTVPQVPPTSGLRGDAWSLALQRLPRAGAFRGRRVLVRRQLDQRPGDRLRPRARPVHHRRELVAGGRAGSSPSSTATCPPTSSVHRVRRRSWAARCRPRRSPTGCARSSRRRPAIRRRSAASTPHPDLLAAGLSQSQNYLPHVAEGRIDARPGIADVAGRRRTLHRRHRGDRRRRRPRDGLRARACPSTSPRSPRSWTR